MSVLIEKEYNLDLGFDESDIISRVIDASLDYIRCPYEIEVNVTLVDNKKIKEINKEQRDINKETDVLSFPMIEYDSPGDFSIVEDDYSFFNPDTGELIFGDIVISLDKVVSQSEEYNHSAKREIAFLVAHSMLHLAGYDHIEAEERVEMESKQDEILNSIGITRDYK